MDKKDYYTLDKSYVNIIEIVNRTRLVLKCRVFAKTFLLKPGHYSHLVIRYSCMIKFAFLLQK